MLKTFPDDFIGCAQLSVEINHRKSREYHKIETKAFDEKKSGPALWSMTQMGATNSVTRFGDLLDFGQLFKAFGNN